MSLRDPKPTLTKGEVEGVELGGAPISVCVCSMTASRRFRTFPHSARTRRVDPNRNPKWQKGPSGDFHPQNFADIQGALLRVPQDRLFAAAFLAAAAAPVALPDGQVGHRDGPGIDQRNGALI